MRRRMDCRCPRVRHHHGTEAGYTRDGCRCMPCALARSRYTRALQAGELGEKRTVPVFGVRLRLQALTVLGWSSPEIAARIGLAEETVRKLRSDGNPARTVRLETRDTIADLYERLWNTPSTGMHAARMQNMAKRRGWLAPMALDDDLLDKRPLFYVLGKNEITNALHADAKNHQVIRSEFNIIKQARDIETGISEHVADEMAVARAVAGDSVQLSRVEVSDAVVTMTGMGKSAKEIAERLGMTERSVVRHRAAARRKETA